MGYLIEAFPDKSLCVFCKDQDFLVGYVTLNKQERIFIVCDKHFHRLKGALKMDLKQNG